jgi:hypothetical protein
MNTGLQIARDFFERWGAPFLHEHFPEVTARAAAGRLQGSDVIGGDDEISRDHAWGPQFHLWLSAEDYGAHGERIAEAMNAAAPNPWEGFKLAGGEDKSVEVHSIPRWFEERIQCSQRPTSVDDWRPLTEHESDLYFIRHGAVWVDGSGELSAWRQALAKYPDGILTARIAEECFRVWHYGEYNFVQRMSRRRDPVAIAMCKGEFIDGVMRIVFLMQGDFTPFWKWLAFEFRKLPEAMTYMPLLERLTTSTDVDEQVPIVETICARVHEQLIETGFVAGEGGNPWLLPLLNDYRELRAKGLDETA